MLVKTSARMDLAKFEKNAWLLHTVGLPAVCHVLQNAATKYMVHLDEKSGRGPVRILGDSRKGKGLGVGKDALNRLLTGEGKSVQTAFMGGLVPELGILSDEIAKVGVAVGEKLARQGKTWADLKPEEFDALKHILKGDYEYVVDHDEVFDFATDVISAISPDAGDAFRMLRAGKDVIPGAKEKLREVAVECGNVHKSNKILGKLMMSMGNCMTPEAIAEAVRKGPASESAFDKAKRAAAELAGYGLWGWGDGVMVGVNGAKRLLSSEGATEALKSHAATRWAGDLLESAQKRSGDYFVKEPLAASSKAGLDGKPFPIVFVSDSEKANNFVANHPVADKVNRTFDEMGINAVTNSAKDFAYNMSKVLKEHLSEPQYQMLRDSIRAREEAVAKRKAEELAEKRKKGSVVQSFKDAPGDAVSSLKDADVGGVIRNAFKGLKIGNPFS